MSVGDVALFTETCKSLLLDTIKVPSPDCFLRPDGMCWEEHSRNMFAHMERTLAEGHDEIAAVIVEPLIQGRRRHAHVPPGLTSSCCAKPATAMACT